MKCAKETGSDPDQEDLSPATRRALKAQLDRLVGDFVRDLLGEAPRVSRAGREDENPRR